MNIAQAISELYAFFEEDKMLRSVAIFIDKKTKVQITKTFKNQLDFRLTIGKLNYLQRLHAKKLIKADVDIEGVMMIKKWKKPTKKLTKSKK